MKKFIPKLLLFTCVAMIVAACSNKDTAKPNTTGDIVGKWSIASDTTRVYDNKGSLTETDVNDQISPDDYVQFNGDGTGTEQEFDIKFGFNYTIKNSVLTMFSKGGTQGGITVDDDTEVVTIKHLDSHTLYTFQVTPDTIGNSIYQLRESIHFTK
jgi:hypothetical protein